MPRRPEATRCPGCKSLLWDSPLIRPVHRRSTRRFSEIIGPKRKAFDTALRAHKAWNPRIFGSVARGEANRRSDIDLLVDFEPDASAFDQVGLIADLERLFGRKVDVAEPAGLHWLVRPQVLFEAVPI